MESLESRVFFSDFANAMKKFINAEYIVMDTLHHVGRIKLNKRVQNNISKVENQVINQAILADKFINDFSGTLNLVKQGFSYINTVEQVLGTDYADILALRYAKNFNVRLIAKICKTSKTTVNRKLNIALDWLDSTPESYIRNNQGIAEKR